ncbi:MAG TPA: BON domain-containing protein [Edaphobacter sp.]|nr:BON domain-containing protein [Edaphobacter sp.]
MTTATLTRTDEQIRNDLLAELKWDPQVQANEIGVAVKDGIVTLTGWVDSYLKKWRAEEDVLRLAGCCWLMTTLSTLGNVCTSL